MDSVPGERAPPCDRRAVRHAHPDNMIVIDEKLAQLLEEAWSAYDVAVIESVVADLRRRT